MVDSFRVTNTGSNTDTYTFTCGATSGVTCSGVNPTSATLTTQEGLYVLVTYTLAAPGGTLKLFAAGEESDSGSYAVSANPSITLVAPVLTSGSRAVVRTRQPLIRGTFLPNGSPIDTTKTVLTWRTSTDTVTKFQGDSRSMARHNRGLLEWEVDSIRWLGVGDSALITMKVCAQNTLCTTTTRWAVVLNDSKPVLGFAGTPLEALGRQFGAPFGPGLAVSGAEVETAFGIPAYFSMGTARSAGLVYSTRQSYPRALVPVDLELTWPVGTPDQIKLILFDGVTKLDSLVLSSPTCATGAARRCRAVLQGDFSGSTFTTPTRKWLTVEARVTSGVTTQIGTDSVEVVVVDRRATPYGSGWWPGGFLKLVQAGGDRLLIGPTGTANIYRGHGDSLYVSPPGEFTALVKTSTGWELRPRGSTAKLVFDSNGRLAKSVDQNGNRDSIVYSGTTDQITSFVDPIGKTITLAYSGGKLSTFTDPGSRQSKVTINGTNQLTYDSISSPTSRAYRTTFVYQTYPGTNTVVLTKTIGVILDTTIVTYDSTFKRRPVQVRLAQVKDENGNTVNPVITYTAYERRGYGGLVSLDSVYVELKDPRNNWTRSLLNRWAGARKTWDALGVLGQTQYTAEGFVIWSEGKVVDSSRAYHTYDAQRRLARSYIIRAVSDTFRIDSLIYDASHRVIRRIGASRDTSRFVYDANGNLTQAFSPSNDITRYWYRSNGLLDSTRAPGNTKSRWFWYDGTWSNVHKVLDESGTIRDSVRFDNVGRDTVHLSKLRVQVATGVPAQWQWRWMRTYYSVANEVDSTRLLRTANCADPCNTPPATTVDTLRLRHRFDRAGRDSLRINDLGKAVLYLYDRLGRLLSRRPWTDSMAVKDSFVYDVAGNVRKIITRRGDTFTTNYDSRNRDTLSTIPGVGTLRKKFSGPLDQLTRMWYDSPVDSIGGVTGTLAWVYDIRGRLKADTSFSGAVARATTYTYDTWERPATRVDALGTWTTRYETARGYADTLLTPMGDTITYLFDAKSRAIGPYVRGGGPLQSRVPVWDQTGTLNTLTHSVSTAPSFVALQFDRQVGVDDPQPFEAIRWDEQHGAGSPSYTLRDTIVYDGWQRVIAYRALKNGVAVDSVSFTFDRNGNIANSHYGTTYDATTDRLVTRTGDACGTWSYTYDRAGNLTQGVCGSTTWVYGYDPANRLRSVRRNGTLIARYAYDVVGRRIAKRVYSSASGGIVAYTRFVYRGSDVGFETDSAGTNIGLHYTHGQGVDDLLAIRDASGNHYYVVTDFIGSVRGLVKRDGTWQRSLRYGAYGAVISDTAAASAPTWELRYRWTGREYDSETGWYYFRARYLDPSVRRFVQEDPIGYAGGGNGYAYGNGSPLEGRDPSGTVMNYERMACNVCGRIGHQQEVYFDGAPVGGGSLGGVVISLLEAQARFDAGQRRVAAHAADRARVAKQAGIEAKLGAENAGVVSVGAVEAAMETRIQCCFDSRFKNTPPVVEEKSWGLDPNGIPQIHNLRGTWTRVDASSAWRMVGYIFRGTFDGVEAAGWLNVIPLGFTALKFGHIYVGFGAPGTTQ